MAAKQFTLKQLSLLLDAEMHGDGDKLICSLASPANATADEICFLADDKYLAQVESTLAGVVIVRERHLASCPAAALVVDDPYLAFAKCSVLFDDAPAYEPAVHPTAVVDSTAVLGDAVHVGAHAVIEAGVVLADGVSIAAGCFVGERTTIGAGTQLKANVTLYHNVVIGRSCIIHSGAVIGSDGFGFAPQATGWQRIAQLGRVVIGDNVSIGSNGTIDRGALDDTVIGNGVIIDNIVHIAHNVVIGDMTAIAGCVGIAGSVNIGRRCILAGGVSIAGHLTIADGAQISGRTVVTKSIKSAGSYSSGTPMLETPAWRRSAVRVGQLDKLFERVKDLEKGAKALAKS
ncbi:UDP-3-O-[3-hydroxymyristoyl] glucosamine N-acyltransferase [Sinobacterium caligoides]|uniref:UDP-3-O-acylglucosamine N-acyltransferase n=1 Tax=Sinobacterium caligoides TaxID=933926 RepID=A0A3N2DML3_9GAMM|nr:UDP-3-O-(3-hydroxymyristoyl)glucosamine N-acyltransferase [Sinobacterium caligoides]ROS01038.1 UDP-3-O-[3-hydroxymyristoyl] glucosamine N-acyltransferase [Sinobacterium caligoides]